MKAIDAMVVWTPNRDPFGQFPFKGLVAVTTIPEKAILKNHPKSMGACDYNCKKWVSQGELK